MTKKYDFLIVGAGIAGIVMAERLSSIGKKILLIDKRDHIGGNCYDFRTPSGLLVHKYGPHYFRTNHQEIFEYLSNFTEWYNHRYKVLHDIKGKLYTFPINLNTLREFFGIDFTEQEAVDFLEEKRDKTIKIPNNAEEQVLFKIGTELYETFFKGYTEKQWGIKATELHPSVTARIPIRLNKNDDYIDALIQAMPKDGYTCMFEKMLLNDNIKLSLNTSFDESLLSLCDNIIWTGSIDEYFNYEFGKLPYRSLNFEFTEYDVEYLQPCEQINYPHVDIPWTRTVEIKHATSQKHPKTIISKEFPSAVGDPYYPIPAIKNNELYEKYKKLSEENDKVFFIGRLAQYKYLNMDEVVKEALDLFNIINTKNEKK